MLRALLIVLVVAGCGRIVQQPVTPVPTPVTPISKTDIVVAAFGADWCTYCHQYIPELAAVLDKLSERGRIELRLYVSGEKSQAAADAFRNSLHINATAYPDPGGKVQKVWVGSSGIPAAAVLSTDEKVIKAYRSIDAQAIAYFVNQQLK